MEGTQPFGQWCNLPEDILTAIFQLHVESGLQNDFRRRLRAVCSSWRTIVPLPRKSRFQFPLQVPSFDDESSSDSPFLLLESIYFFMYPLAHSYATTDDAGTSNPSKPKGWLVQLRELKHNTWRLLNPISKDILFYCNPPTVSKIDCLLDFQIREITRSYDLIGVSNPCRGVSVSLSEYEDENVDLTAAVIDAEGQLAVWEAGDTHWTKLNPLVLDKKLCTEYNPWIVHWCYLASHMGKFYTIDLGSHQVCVIEPVKTTTSNSQRFKTSIIPAPLGLSYEVTHIPSNFHNFLVECKGQLYYVLDQFPILGRKCSDRVISIYVLRGHDSTWWECVDNCMELADEVVFLLFRAHFTLPTRDLHNGLELGAGGGWMCGMSGFPYYCFVTPSYFKGIEVLDSMAYPLFFTCFSRCQLLKLEGNPRHSCELFENLPDDDFTSVFFPPPSWLKWSCPSRGDVEVKFADLPFCKDRPHGQPKSSVTTSAYRVNKNKKEIEALSYL